MYTSSSQPWGLQLVYLELGFGARLETTLFPPEIAQTVVVVIMMLRVYLCADE